MKAEACSVQPPLRGAILRIDGRGWDPSAFALADAVMVDPDPVRLTSAERHHALVALALRVAASGRPMLVGLGPVESEQIEALVGVLVAKPDAVVAPAASAADLQRLGAALAVAEAENGIADGATGVVAAIRDAAAVLALPSLQGASRRLRAILWEGSSALPGHPTAAARVTARGLVVLSAAAADVPAIDGTTVAPRTARGEGFAAQIGRDVAALRAIRAAFGALTPGSDG